MTSNILYRKNAILAKVHHFQEEKCDLYCSIDGCIHNSFYLCYMCKNYTCIHHTNNLGGDKNNHTYACTGCYLDERFNDVIVATQLHNNRKGFWGELREKIVRFISFEWIHHVGDKVKPI